MMRYFRHIGKSMTATAMLAMAILLSVSCTEYPETSFTDIENRSLKAWITKYHPDLLGNFQEDGGYYVEVLDEGIADSVSIKNVLAALSESDNEGYTEGDYTYSADGCWVSFDITARDLQGQVCLTRDGSTALMQGTFTKFTHYVPYFRFIGNENLSLLEGTYLAMKNELTLSEEYILDKGLVQTNDNKLEMRGGTRLRLYLPSSIAGGAAGVTGDGGYEGSFSLDGNRPMIIDIEITDRINNPVAYEGYLVDGFGDANGGVSPLKEVTDEDDDEEDTEASSRRRFFTRADDGDDDEDEEEEDDGMYWRHACDTIPGLLVSKHYVPNPKQTFTYDFDFAKDNSGEAGVARFAPYSDNGVYADFYELNAKVEQALLDRFGEGSTDGEKVGTEGTAKVWYVTRIFDGFIVDSNIAEVRELIYGADEAEDSSLSYSPEEDKDTYVTAWYYTIPHVRYGEWATILTTSTFAYGSTGRTGSTTTSSSGSAYSYLSYYNMYNYYNSMYGYGYSDMYYYNMYNMANYYGSMYSGDTEETTQISSEIQPFTPLIFQVYIEEK